MRHTRGTGCGLWPTPRQFMFKDANHDRGKSNLGEVVHGGQVKHWPTPRSNTAMSATITNNADPDRYPNLETVMKKREPQAVGGQLNPSWVCWLMGWPIGWESLEPMKEMIWLDWSVDPADFGGIPRVAVGIKDRVHRLQALGNGQVSLCTATAWEILKH